MRALLELICQDPDLKKAPPIVQNAMHRMLDRWSKPPVPLMSQDEYEKLPRLNKCILTCNMPGCGKVVSTHGMLCVEHRKELR